MTGDGMPDMTATATRFAPPSDEVQRRRVQAADRPGEHLWVVMAAWLVPDPATPGVLLLDQENLITVTSRPGCFKCERFYSPELAAQRCTGSLYPG